MHSGYGHMAPKTEDGKLFCVFYSLLGVPINGILIGSLGAFFGSKVVLNEDVARIRWELLRFFRGFFCS